LYNNIGILCKSKGDLDKAIEYYEKSLAIRLKNLVADHPDIAISYSNIGFTWKSKGDYDKALDNYKKCLAIRLKILDPEHPDLTSLYNNLGSCNYELKHFSLAIDLFKKGYSISNKGVFPFKIAQCYEALKNSELALDYFIQSAEIRKVDPKCGLDNEQTKISIKNAKRIAKELGKENDLPDWIRAID
jgi:tetratricopeptide (TPR) repeat protein